MAVYGAREALILGGRRCAQEKQAAVRPGLPPLERFETRGGDDAAYAEFERARR